jgi:neprilysin
LLDFVDALLKIKFEILSVDEVEQLRAKPLLDLLDDKLGGWPILNPNWQADRFDLFNVLAKIRRFGDQPFFSVSVDKDMEKPSENLIFITEPQTFAAKDVLLSDAGKMYTDSYQEYLFNVTSLLLKESGDQQDVAKVSAELMDIMELGRYISLVSTTL